MHLRMVSEKSSFLCGKKNDGSRRAASAYSGFLEMILRRWPEEKQMVDGEHTENFFLFRSGI